MSEKNLFNASDEELEHLVDDLGGQARPESDPCEPKRCLGPRVAFWAAVIALVIIGAFALAAQACDALIVTGYAHHGDRDHHYRSLTGGAGCEWILGDWRAGATAFQNSNTKPTLLLGGAWLPLHAGPWSAGVAFGDALFGYDRTHQLAGGIALEVLGRELGADAIYVPRVAGMKGAVLWLRAKVLRNWEPLK